MKRQGIAVLPPAAVAVAGLGLWEQLWGRPWWIVVVAIPAGWLLIVVTAVVTRRKGLAFAFKQAAATVAAPLRTPVPLGQAGFVLAAAAGEELLFRLLGLQLLGDGAVGIAVTTAIFALAHLRGDGRGRSSRWLAVVDAALCGALLAGLFVVTGGAAAAIGAHFLRNISLDALRRGLSRRGHDDEDVHSARQERLA